MRKSDLSTRSGCVPPLALASAHCSDDQLPVDFSRPGSSPPRFQSSDLFLMQEDDLYADSFAHQKMMGTRGRQTFFADQVTPVSNSAPFRPVAKARRPRHVPAPANRVASLLAQALAHFEQGQQRQPIPDAARTDPCFGINISANKISVATRTRRAGLQDFRVDVTPFHGSGPKCQPHGRDAGPAGNRGQKADARILLPSPRAGHRCSLLSLI